MQGFAYVTFASYEALQAALQMDGTQVEGRALSVALAHQPVAEGEKEAFILNLPASADSDALQSLLSVSGPIKSLRLPLDKSTNELRVRFSVFYMLEYTVFGLQVGCACQETNCHEVCHYFGFCMRCK